MLQGPIDNGASCTEGFSCWNTGIQFIIIIIKKQEKADV